MTTPPNNKPSITLLEWHGVQVAATSQDVLNRLDDLLIKTILDFALLGRKLTSLTIDGLPSFTFIGPTGPVIINPKESK